MTSVQSQYSQVPSNKLYVNLGNCSNAIFTSTGTTKVAWSQVGGTTINTQLATAGLATFRDLGKTIYLPSPTQVPVGAVPGISTVLRQVQLIPTGINGTYGAGGPASGLDTDYFTGYIQLSALQQGGGGNGAPVTIVRLN
jgi:hypothetical protein